MGEIRIARAGADRVDELEPMWKSLVEHQAAIDPGPRGIPVRDPDDSWPYRRAEYRQWLSDPDAFVLIATEGSTPVGYALVSVNRTADDHWATGDVWAELQTLVVLPAHRGSGLGGRMMDRVHEELRRLGIRELLIGVVATNVDALRFYERFGYRPWMIELLGRIPEEP